MPDFLIWLIPFCLFWLMAALYLGGMAVDVVGGNGVRQVLGLLATFILFMVLWKVLSLALRGTVPVLGEIIVPSLVSVLALPLLSRGGFGILGVRVKRGHHEAH